jgi:seryl-tRNA synthetase
MIEEKLKHIMYQEVLYKRYTERVQKVNNKLTKKATLKEHNTIQKMYDKRRSKSDALDEEKHTLTEMLDEIDCKTILFTNKDKQYIAFIDFDGEITIEPVKTLKEIDTMLAVNKLGKMDGQRY